MQRIHMKKYQYLINKREKVGLNRLNDPKAFMEYSNDMQDCMFLSCHVRVSE